jgi:CheY-specific phosphatase CheX
MTGVLLRLETVIEAVAKHASHYLKHEARIENIITRKSVEGAQALPLEYYTAMIGIGGSAGFLVALSYSPELSEALFQHTTAGLLIPPEQRQMYLNGTLTEVANVILGHAVPDAAPSGDMVAISPPVILEGAKFLHLAQDARFGSIAIASSRGALNIHLVSVQTIVDHYLNR